MTGKEFKKIYEAIETEALDECFLDNEFKEIKDEEFHKLRLAYLKSRKELVEYLGIE